jgi:hypothetical protein
MSLFSGMRDAAIQMKVMSLIRENTGAIKNMKDLEIDSKQKMFSLKLELAGESEPLAVTGNYRLVVDNGKTVFEPVDIKTSKEWLTILAAELLKGRTFEVPSMLGSIL